MNGRREHILSILLGAGLVAAIAPPAGALPPFWKEFEATYVKPDSKDPKEQAFAALATDAKSGKCNVCHVPDQKKNVRNAYGAELSKLLKKDNFKKERLAAEPDKVKQEIDAALAKVAALHSVAGDDKSPTFGQVIAEGRLPAVASAAAVAATDPSAKPKPEPPAVSPPSGKEDQAAASKAIEAIGGSVSPLAVRDKRMAVDFHLDGTALDDARLAYVKSIGNLYELNLKGTQITDAGLANLAGLAALVRLHLEKTSITDAGLVHLAGLKNLEYLNLYGTAVTDAGLDHLAGLTNLKKLYLWQTQVTDEGVKKLGEKLPELVIVK